jgi:hypothetical protein
MPIRENRSPRPADTGAAAASAESLPVTAGQGTLQARDAGARAAAGTPAGRPAHQRPDPRPMRFALAAGGFAAVSALLATISASAVPASASVVTVQQDSPADTALVQHVTKVVKLPPGVAAPANAGPNVLVTKLPAPVAKPRTIIVTTTQSGRVVKP